MYSIAVQQAAALDHLLRHAFCCPKSRAKAARPVSGSVTNWPFMAQSSQFWIAGYRQVAVCFQRNSDIPGPLRYPSSVNDKARGVMNWEAFGAVAELLAAVGGLAAVIYLAIRIKLNTTAVRSASVDSWVSAISVGNAALAPTDEFIKKAREGYDELDSHQRIRNIYTVSFLHADTLERDVRTLLAGQD